MLHIPNEEQDKDVRGVQLFTSVGGNVTVFVSKAGSEYWTNDISCMKVADFPLVVNGVHRKGDVFVEVGPADHRTAAIKQILQGSSIAVQLIRNEGAWHRCSNLLLF